MILRIIQRDADGLTFIKIFAIIICNLPRDDHNDHNFPGCLYFNGPLFWNSSNLNLLKTVTIVLMSIITIILIIEYNHEHNHHHLQRLYSYIEVVSLTPHLLKREANLESHSAQNYIYMRDITLPSMYSGQCTLPRTTYSIYKTLPSTHFLS